MNDFERRLSESLKSSTEGYRPSDPYLAKQRFMKRYQRRRIVFYGAGVALAGTAVFAAVTAFPRSAVEPTVRPLPPAAVAPVLTTIDVGENPSGVAYGDGRVWVANTGEGSVSVIDPLTNSVTDTYEVGGFPGDVSVGLGAAWVSDGSRGVVTKLAFGQEDEPVEIELGTQDQRLDVAPGVGYIWVVAEGGSLYRIDPRTNEAVVVEGVGSASDVAAGQDTVVVLTDAALLQVDPNALTTAPLADVESTEDQDLQLSEGAVWFADGDEGRVTRYSLETAKASKPVYVGGAFTAIASGEGSMWLISGDSGDDGNLTRIDPNTAEIVGDRVFLEGRPVDVTTGASSVWVVSRSARFVTRLDPDALP